MDRRGFSLMEAMVVVGIFAIIGMAIAATSSAGHQFWSVGDAATQTQMNFRRALGYLEEDLKEAKASYTTVGSGGTTGSYITFKVPIDLADGSNNGVLKSDGKCCDWGAKDSTSKYIRYVLEAQPDDTTNNQLVRCIVSGTGGSDCSGGEDRTVVANRMAANGLTFSKLSGGKLVTVTMTTTKKARTSGTGSDNGWTPTLLNKQAKIMLRN